MKYETTFMLFERGQGFDQTKAQDAKILALDFDQTLNSYHMHDDHVGKAFDETLGIPRLCFVVNPCYKMLQASIEEGGYDKSVAQALRALKDHDKFKSMVDCVYKISDDNDVVGNFKELQKSFKLAVKDEAVRTKLLKTFVCDDDDDDIEELVDADIPQAQAENCDKIRQLTLRLKTMQTADLDNKILDEQMPHINKLQSFKKEYDSNSPQLDVLRQALFAEGGTMAMLGGMGNISKLLNFKYLQGLNFESEDFLKENPEWKDGLNKEMMKTIYDRVREGKPCAILSHGSFPKPIAVAMEAKLKELGGGEAWWNDHSKHLKVIASPEGRKDHSKVHHLQTVLGQFMDDKVGDGMGLEEAKAWAKDLLQGGNMVFVDDNANNDFNNDRGKLKQVEKFITDYKPAAQTHASLGEEGGTFDDQSAPPRPTAAKPRQAPPRPTSMPPLEESRKLIMEMGVAKEKSSKYAQGFVDNITNIKDLISSLTSLKDLMKSARADQKKVFLDDVEHFLEASSGDINSNLSNLVVAKEFANLVGYEGSCQEIVKALSHPSKSNVRLNIIKGTTALIKGENSPDIEKTKELARGFFKQGASFMNIEKEIAKKGILQQAGNVVYYIRMESMRDMSSLKANEEKERRRKEGPAPKTDDPRRACGGA